MHQKAPLPSRYCPPSQEYMQEAQTRLPHLEKALGVSEDTPRPVPKVDGKTQEAGTVTRAQYTQEVVKVQETQAVHVAIADCMLANPQLSIAGLARMLGYSPAWVRTIARSELFQAYLAKRKGDLVDPLVTRSMENKIKDVIDASLDIVEDKLAVGGEGALQLAVKMLETLPKAAGMGQKNTNIQVNNSQYVALLPNPAPDAESWLKQAGKEAGEVIEHEIGGKY